MTGSRTRIMVVGGGATGVGIVRDLALRGVETVLVEQKDLAHGASFRFHGLLHSGARYAVNDPAAARECAGENRLLGRVASTCVKKCGGLFLQLASDPDDYAEAWLAGCRQAGIEAAPVAVEDVLRENPYLTGGLKRAYRVEDGVIDGARLVWTHAFQAASRGAKVLTYTKLTAIRQAGGKVEGAETVNTLTGEKTFWECEMIINAAGAWAEEVAKLGGARLSITKNKGSLLVFNQPFTAKVLNRLRAPGDGDIIVPHHTVTILGTTSINIEDLDAAPPTAAEVDQLLAAGRELIPEIDSQRLLRVYAGIRPLYAGAVGGNDDGRDISREFVIIDHGREGLRGLVSLIGGKLTTYRLIAEKTVDYVCRELGIAKPCLTAQIPLVAPELLRGERGKVSKYVFRYGEKGPSVQAVIDAHPEKADVICECEDICGAEIEEISSWESTKNLDDLRRKTRVGMGTCQGLYCSFRSLGAAWRFLREKPEPPLQQLLNFLENRFRGQKYLLWESQIRECELTLGIYSAIFNIERAEESEV
ncbi:MAG: anaerobic glycerol-3-phosphate dehydrogenase subunit A [Gracilibacteraceae bacterium]|jgi:glycerol-3-phosphate dehydrogenase|nr:anaerobic glycerol-3-phosphate dehydrogenase subunit A [Gracilibacteraceae bacterium]